MAAISVSASLLKCSVAHKINNRRSMSIKVGQMKKLSLPLQRRSFKLCALAEEKDEDEDYHIGMSLSEGIDKDLLRKYGANAFLDKAPQEYNKAIEILSFGGFTDEALELKQCMEMKRIPLSKETYVPIIIGLCLQSNKIPAAMDLLNESKTRPGCEPDKFSYGAIIERMCMENKPRAAFRLLQVMLSDGLVPLQATISGLVEALVEKKHFATATKVVHEILAPEYSNYKCLIEAFESADEAILAKNALALMQQRGVDPTHDCYSSVLEALGRNEMFDEADEVLQEMEAKGMHEIPKEMEEWLRKERSGKISLEEIAAEMEGNGIEIKKKMEEWVAHMRSNRRHLPFQESRQMEGNVFETQDHLVRLVRQLGSPDSKEKLLEWIRKKNSFDSEE